MKDFFFLLISITLIGVAIFSILNYILLRKIKKAVNSNSTLQEKELFFELKSRIQVMVAVFSVMVAVFAFYGYNTEEKINSNIDNQVKNRFEYYDSTYAVINKQSKSIASLLQGLKDKNDSLVSYANTLKNSLSHIQKVISKNTIPGVFIVNRLPFDIKTEGSKRFYYKDLTTNNGGKLPSFNRPPVLSFTQNKGKICCL